MTHRPPSLLLSRRAMLRRAGLGFGSWALLDLLDREGRLPADSSSAANPLAAKSPHARRAPSA